MTDERKGLPSASSSLQDSLCPGRFRAQRDYADAMAADMPDEDAPEEVGSSDASAPIDQDAESGKRIHLLYAGKTAPGATGQEEERAAAGREVDQFMYGKWLENFQYEGLGNVIEIRERRWWLKDDAGEPIYSGQTDAVWIRGRPGEYADILVADLKGLYGQHDPAKLNMQIRRYIALICVNIKELGYTELRTAAAYLNQPAKTMNPEMVLFEAPDLEQAVLEMHIDLAAIMDPEAPRVPGPIQCHRCLAKLTCPEFLSQSESMVGFKNLTAIPETAAIQDKISKLTGPHLAAMLPWAKALRNVADIAEFEAKRRLATDPNAVPGWRLKSNPDRHKVDDCNKVFNRLHTEYGVTPEEFTKLCSVTKLACTTTVREKSKLKGKALEKKMDEIFEGATKVVKVNRSLEQVE